MSIAVTTTDPTNTGVSTTSSSSLTGSNAADLQSSFLTLLVAQLKNQDPTNPMENNELTSQLAQISTVSGIEKLNTTLGSISGQIDNSQSLQASNLIGHGVMIPGTTENLLSTAQNFDTCGGDMLDKLDAALRFQQEALNLRAQRQEVLAANIANADTPGYQARDIDFASELKKVMQRGRDATSVVALTMTSTQHIPAQALTPPTAELQYRIPDQPSLDGNTVDMDRERTQFADNSLQYQMSLSALSGQIKGMMNVLQSGN